MVFSPVRIVLAVTLVYTCGFFFWYSATPLGMVPHLDGKETLQMAESIQQRTLPAEPFYRAPFYPACLSLFLTIGLPSDWLPLTARLCNGLCHLISTLLIYRIAHQLWQREHAAVLSSLLFGLNPVVLHFAADPLDITLAITLLLTTLWLCQSNKYEVSNKKNPDTPSVGVSASPFWRASFSSVSFYKRACLAGLCIGLGVITRPHLLPIACILPMLLFFKKPLSALAALGGTALVLLTFACTNTAISGQFKLLPTQGAYNLWAANKPGAHGKFFAQSVFIHNQEQHSNPTRVEARTLYLQETHATSPINEATINAYWRNKIITTIVHDPLTWISQMVRKTYYLLNHYEQYNNKTYHMHKSLSPWLRYNPINWTIMLVLGLAGLLLSLRHPTSRIIAWMIVVYAAGVLLFFVSARFRLPLIPLLAIMAGGCLMLKAKDRRQKAEGGERSQESEARSQNVGPSHGTLDHVKQFTLKQWLASITGLLGIGTLSLTSFAQVDDSSTAVQDYMLMSRANLELQHYDTALRSAEQALQLNPQHPAALEIACLAQYAILVEQLPELPPTAILQQNLQQCLHVSAFSPQARFNAGIYAHLLGQKQQAQQLWYSLIDQQSNQLQPALAALQFTHALRAADKAIITSLPLDAMNTMLLMSEIYAGNEQAKEHLNGLWSPAEKQYHLQIINGLFFNFSSN